MTKSRILAENTEHALRRRASDLDFRRAMLTLNTLDVFTFKDDFFGDAIDARWQTGITNGASSAALAIVAAVNGTATQITGTADNGYAGDFLGLHYQGQLHAVMACRLKCSAVTTLKVEVGFTDSGADAGAVNLLATPTFTATDAALWVLDTDDTANWQLVGVKADTAATKIEPAYPPVAATYETLIVALVDDEAIFYHLNANGDLDKPIQRMPSAITKTVDLTPWLFVQARAGSASRTVTYDYVTAYQWRTSS